MRAALSHRWRSLGVLVLALAGWGCESQQSPNGDADVGALPTYQVVAEAYNARLLDLPRLRAPVSVVVESTKEDGSRARDQLEGNLSVEVPRKVALRLDKVGQNAAYLGSNERLYWWMGLADKDAWVAVGTHLKAMPDDAAEFGLPVHPLEFIELLGILELPGRPPDNLPAEALSRAKDGRSVVVTLPSRWGQRRFTLDAATYFPSRIELLTERGTPAATAVLARYAPVQVEGKPGTIARVATNITLTVPQNDTKIILVLADPKGPLNINPRSFDLVELVKAYDIKRLLDLDADKPPPKILPVSPPGTSPSRADPRSPQAAERGSAGGRKP